MFERNRVDTTQQRYTVAVEVTLTDGAKLKGNVSVPMSKSLAEILNGSLSFIEFVPFDGEPQLVAKTSLRMIKELQVPSRRRLGDASGANAAFDPFAVLGLQRGASASDLRQAYHRLSMTYHPDRYATVELPEEVQEYLQSMARRINTAYSMLHDETAEATRVAKMRTEPVYQSHRS